MFFLLWPIFIVTPFVQPTIICPSTDYCKCWYNHKKTGLNFDCRKNDLRIFVKLFQKERLSISGGSNDSNVFDLLPVLNQSFFLEEYRLTMRSTYFTLNHFSLITKKFPSPSQVEFINMNIKIIDVNFFDHQYPILDLNLSKNRIKTFSENVFTNLVKMRSINLSFNQFKTLPASLFRENKDLMHFVFNGNPFEIVLREGFLANKEHLNTVSMENSSKILLTPGTFENCSHLEIINLAYDKIQSLNG